MATAPRYLTVVIRLPDDPIARRAVATDFRLFDKYKDGEVTALYAGDAITENELMEPYIKSSEVRLIRAQVNEDHLPTATLEA